MTYAEKLRDPRWQKKRLEILNAAGFKCEDCGRRDLPLEVHHCAYVRGRNPWDYDITLLMSVCEICHEWRQSREDALRVAIGEMTRFMKRSELEAEAWELLGESKIRQSNRLAEAFQ